MKTIVKQLAFAAPALFIIVIIFSSFKSANRNSIANGSGIADGTSFSFNAIEQKDGVIVGHIQYGDNDYTVNGVKWLGTSAILYTSDGHAFYVCDNKGPVTDWISDPIAVPYEQQLNSADFYFMHFVNTGNIQVKQ
jgi:hypothetical protein